MSAAQVPSSRGSRLRKPLALAALCLGQCVLQIDTTIVNVALPSIARDLHAGTSELQWIVDGYILVLASLLLTSGRIGDRSGHKRVYLVGLCAFGLGSALCALAGSAGQLVAFRVLQGIGASIELPATLALILSEFPDARERAQAVGIWAGSGGLTLVLGPVIGGALIHAFSWRAVFLVNVPLVLVTVGLVLYAVRETSKGRSGRLDWRGQVLGASGLALLAAAAIEGGRQGFTASLPLAFFVGGLLVIVAFLAVERADTQPMLPLAYFRNRAYAAANANGVVMGFVMFSILFLFALYFQQVLGYSALKAGLSFIPLCGAFAITGPVIGRICGRIGYRLPMVIGLCAIACGALLLLRVGVEDDYGSIWLPFVLAGVGYGMTSTPMAASVLAAAPPSHGGMASSTNNTARQIGGVFGIAILGSLLPATSTALGYGQQFVTSLHEALIIATIVAACGAVIALASGLRRRPRAREEPRPRLS